MSEGGEHAELRHVGPRRRVDDLAEADSSIADRRRPIRSASPTIVFGVDVFEQRPVAFGQVGDVALEGEQVALVFPASASSASRQPAAGQGVDAPSTPPVAYALCQPTTRHGPTASRTRSEAGSSSAIEHGAGHDHRGGQGRVRRPDHAVGDVGRRAGAAGSEDAEPERHVDGRAA